VLKIATGGKKTPTINPAIIKRQASLFIFNVFKMLSPTPNAIKMKSVPSTSKLTFMKKLLLFIDSFLKSRSFMRLNLHYI
jgi:hypothetical protein